MTGASVTKLESGWYDRNCSLVLYYNVWRVKTDSHRYRSQRVSLMLLRYSEN